jgi:hypothetical protein
MPAVFSRLAKRGPGSMGPAGYDLIARLVFRHAKRYRS